MIVSPVSPRNNSVPVQYFDICYEMSKM